MSVLLLLTLAAQASANCSDSERRRLSRQVTRAVETGDETQLSGEQVLEIERELLRIVEQCRYGYPLFELGKLYERVGRSHDALTIFDELLADGRYELSNDARAYVERAAAQARRSVSHLVVRWRPEEASVLLRLDGVTRGELAGGQLRIRVNPGERLLRIESPLREAVEQTVLAPDGETETVQVVLPPEDRTGELVVASDADVVIRLGEHTAVGQLDLRLDAGDYEVELENDIASRSESVEVAAGEVRRYLFDPPDRRRRRRAWIGTVVALVVAGALATTLALTLRDGGDNVTPDITDVGIPVR